MKTTIPEMYDAGLVQPKETHEGQIGPFSFSIAEKKTTIIPTWASVAVIVAGVVLLVIDRK